MKRKTTEISNSNKDENREMGKEKKHEKEGEVRRITRRRRKNGGGEKLRKYRGKIMLN